MSHEQGIPSKSTSHKHTLIVSLLFVHTARRYPGLNCSEKCWDLLLRLRLQVCENSIDRYDLNRVKVATRYR